MKKIISQVLITMLMVFTGSSIAAASSSSLGVNNGKLSACPDSPNCVNSFANDDKHAIRPFSYDTPKEVALQVLKYVVSTQDYTKIIKETDNYLHVQFKTRWFRFVDDVEFYFPDNEPVVHIRSCSRVGYWDMGKNRKRMETLRTLFTEELRRHQ